MAHGQGVPGIFFRYDLEPIHVTVQETSVTLAQFLLRIAGIIGGIWVCASYAVRVVDRCLFWAFGRAASMRGFSLGLSPSRQYFFQGLSG